MTTATHSRRTVRYSTLDEFLTDAEEIISRPHRTVGEWTTGQILEHLARTMNASIDGFGVKAPWLIRVTIGAYLKNSALIRPMKPGVKLPKKAARFIPAPDVNEEEALAACRSAVDRFDNEDPVAPHPMFGAMAREEWIQLHLRHSEMHMSFIVPE